MLLQTLNKKPTTAAAGVLEAIVLVLPLPKGRKRALFNSEHVWFAQLITA